MKYACDSIELLKALMASGLSIDQFTINGEELKQEDGTFLTYSEVITRDASVANTIQQIFEQQKARNWKSWRTARDKILDLEQKSGTNRKDRDIALKIFGPTDFQYKSAKTLEDQIEPLRQIMRTA